MELNVGEQVYISSHYENYYNFYYSQNIQHHVTLIIHKIFIINKYLIIHKIFNIHITFIIYKIFNIQIIMIIHRIFNNRTTLIIRLLLQIIKICNIRIMLYLRGKSQTHQKYYETHEKGLRNHTKYIFLYFCVDP